VPRVRVTPAKPAVLYLRMAPQLRAALAERAAESGVSLNAWAVNALAAAAGRSSSRRRRAAGRPEPRSTPSR